MAEDAKKCPYSKCKWLLIPIIITAITYYILKDADSVFASDPLSFWFSIVLSFFVGIWTAVGLKKITCDKDNNHNHNHNH